MSEVNSVTFKSNDGKAELEANWYLPTAQATNGAVIVMHGQGYDKEAEPSPGICAGAAALGLTAVRFNFRFKTAGKNAPANSYELLDDFMGAFDFLESFGKEIKPKRLYIVGKSLGGVTAITAAGLPEVAAKLHGVAVLGLPLHDINYTNFGFANGLPPTFRAPLLVVQGQNDPLGNEVEIGQFMRTVRVPNSLEIIAGGGHSYEPTDKALSANDNNRMAKMNMRRVIDLTVKWLGQQDSVREDLRK